jgi:hypothetical protein
LLESKNFHIIEALNGSLANGAVKLIILVAENRPLSEFIFWSFKRDKFAWHLTMMANENA